MATDVDIYVGKRLRRRRRLLGLTQQDLAGQVGAPGESVAAQTKAILAEIDALLAKAGTDKTKILQAIIWLDDMSTFAEMNSVWDGWVPQGNTPARATGEAKLAGPEYKVEIIVTAAA